MKKRDKNKKHTDNIEESNQNKDYRLRKRYLEEEIENEEEYDYKVSYRDKHDKLY